MLFPIAIFPGDDNHACEVEVPDIPGCFSAGDDLDDAMAMAREAIEGHLEVLAEDGQMIPKAGRVTSHAANPAYVGCTWAVIDIDITRYLGKAETLSITLPAYLLSRIDAYVKSHPEQKCRSGFLAEAALKLLQVCDGQDHRSLSRAEREQLPFKPELMPEENEALLATVRERIAAPQRVKISLDDL